MPYFSDADEVYNYIGGVFRAAADHPEVGPKMAAANVNLQVYYSEPDSKITIHFTEPKLTVEDGGDDPNADVKLFMPADIADKYWRGEYNLSVGLAKGQVVREIDALGGAMGLVADRTGIQFKVLNASRGAAVRGPRSSRSRSASPKRAMVRSRKVNGLPASLSASDAGSTATALLSSTRAKRSPSSPAFFPSLMMCSPGFAPGFSLIVSRAAGESRPNAFKSLTG